MTTIIQKIKQEKLITVSAVLVWIFLLFTTISKSYSFFIRNNMEIEMSYIIFRAVLLWGIIALFVPVFIRLAKKFPLEGPSYRNISLHIFASIIFVPTHALIYRVIMTITYDNIPWSWESFAESMTMLIIWVGIVGPLSYWLIIGAYYMRKFYDQYKERQLKNSEMEAELASIRLHVLKVQLHPHFLFNTLHNVNSLMHEDPPTAKSVLNLLKRFLQTSINRVDEQQVLLKEELEFTSTYLDIEKTRFYDRLSVEKEIDKDTLDAQVPSFLLQPLVENAVRHGISKRMERGILRITSKKNNGQLILTVEDNGPGLNGTVNSNGVGLENINQRLDQLYKESKFELLSSSLGGLKVLIEIPFNAK